MKKFIPLAFTLALGTGLCRAQVTGASYQRNLPHLGSKLNPYILWW
jgi:hypothetical protein